MATQTQTVLPPLKESFALQVVNDHDAWNRWVGGHPQQNILQTSEWGELKRRCGWQPLRLALTQDGSPVAGAQVLFKPSPLGPFAYVPRGPLANCDPIRLTQFVRCLDSFLDEMGCLAAKIEPPVDSGKVFAPQLAALGWVRGAEVQPRSTIVIDLTGSIETLHSRLASRTRYNIGLARRHGVTFRQGDRQYLTRFIEMLTETSRRAHFPIHKPSYFEAMWDQFAPAGQVKLFLAEYEGEIMSAALVLISGQRGYYLYGGSSYESRRLKPNDLLQWETMLLLKQIGCAEYDLWGIPDLVGRSFEHGEDDFNASADDAGPLWGVYHFKRGFGGNIVRYAGAFDRVYRPVEWAIVSQVWRLWKSAGSRGEASLARLSGLLSRAFSVAR